MPVLLQLPEDLKLTGDFVAKRYKNLSEAEVHQLAEALRGNTIVTHVQLMGNELSQLSVTALAECVPPLSTPRLLKGLKLFHRMLTQNSTILSLDLRYCDMEDDASPLLIEALQTRTKPMELLLLGNYISPSHEQEIIELSKKPPNMGQSPYHTPTTFSPFFKTP